MGYGKVADDDVGLGFAQIMLGNEGFGVFLSLRVGVVFEVGEETFVADVPSAAYAHPVHADEAV